MNNPWHNQYLKADDFRVAAHALREALQAHDYTAYDPFAGGSGTPPRFKTFIRQFALPLSDGWVRLCGEPDPAALLTLSQHYPLLNVRLAESGGWEVFANGTVSGVPDAFAPFLKPGKNIDDVRRALSGNLPLPSVAPTSPLPADVQQLAQDRNVNPAQANRMMERMTARLFGQLDRGTRGEAHAMQDQARGLVSGSGPDWNSEAGRQIRALADLLTLPSHWREPGWADIRDAYQSARMLARNPKASLLPGEREALTAIPDAGQFVAVYMGKP